MSPGATSDTTSRSEGEPSPSTTTAQASKRNHDNSQHNHHADHITFHSLSQISQSGQGQHHAEPASAVLRYPIDRSNDTEQELDAQRVDYDADQQQNTTHAHRLNDSAETHDATDDQFPEPDCNLYDLRVEVTVHYRPLTELIEEIDFFDILFKDHIDT